LRVLRQALRTQALDLPLPLESQGAARLQMKSLRAQRLTRQTRVLRQALRTQALDLPLPLENQGAV
jgi:hypothetical protein